MPEQQLFPPPAEFSKRASVRSMAEYEALYKAAAEDPEKFWAEQAKRVHWFAPCKKVLDWSNVPFAKWFVGAKTNHFAKGTFDQSRTFFQGANQCTRFACSQISRRGGRAPGS